jgi:chemotaxis protein histidine kinase CheA
MSVDHDFGGDFGTDLSRFSMLDLFRMEARAQARVLTDGLLRSERACEPATLEAMMRAAHSTKGAAAIVGLEPMVRLTHAMEDVFIAAQQGGLALDAGASKRTSTARSTRVSAPTMSSRTSLPRLRARSRTMRGKPCRPSPKRHMRSARTSSTIRVATLWAWRS